MTLCVAWIRQTDQEKELVMATDSRLTGGESWDSGVKLFELPRHDCLLCFAGSTVRAYPLILNSISSIKFDSTLANSYTDIHDVLDSLLELFSSLVIDIREGVEDINELRGQAEFLFGGWSWRKQQFCIWRLYYEPALEVFTHEFLNPHDARVIKFLGNNVNDAERLLKGKLEDVGKIISGTFDMEPLLVLAEMSRDQNLYRPIGGALQIAKVYQSGTSEFFGIMWPSAAGKPTFLGRLLPEHAASTVRLFDPDNATLIEDGLPESLVSPDQDLYGGEYDFVLDCYPEGQLKFDLPEKKRLKLKKVIQQAAYKKYCKEQTANQEVINE
jgi:hypothetical protein